MAEAFAVADIADIALGAADVADVGLGLGAADAAVASEIGVDASLGAEGLGAATDLGAAAATDVGAAADLGAIADVTDLSATDIGVGASGLGGPGDFVGTGLGETDALGVGADPTGGNIGLGDVATTQTPPTGIGAEVSQPTSLGQGLGASDPTLQASQFTPQPTTPPGFDTSYYPNMGQTYPPTPNPPGSTYDPFATFAPEQFNANELQVPSTGDLQMQLSDTLSTTGPQQFGTEAFPPASEFSTVQPGSIPAAPDTAAYTTPSAPGSASANFFQTPTFQDPAAPSPQLTSQAPISDGVVNSGLTTAPTTPPTTSGSIFDNFYSPLSAEDAAKAPQLTSLGSANNLVGSEEAFVNPSGTGPGSAADFQRAALDESLSLGPSGSGLGEGPVVPQPTPVGLAQYPQVLTPGTGNAMAFGDLGDPSLADFGNLNTDATFADQIPPGMDLGSEPTPTIFNGDTTGTLGGGAANFTPSGQPIQAPVPQLLAEGGPTGAPLDLSGSMDLGGPAAAPTSTQQSILNSLAATPNASGTGPTLENVSSVIGQGAPLDTSGVGAGTDIVNGAGTAPTIASTANKPLLSQPIGNIGTLGQIGQLGALLGTGIMALEGPGKLPTASTQAAQVAAFNVQQGEQLLNNAFNGILTPSQNAQIQQQYQTQKSALVQQFYAQGRDPNTDSGFFMALQQIQQELLAQVQTFINADYQQGNAELGLATNADLAVGQQQIQLEQAYQTALANALGSAARLTGSGSININTPSGSTVTTT